MLFTLKEQRVFLQWKKIDGVEKSYQTDERWQRPIIKLMLYFLITKKIFLEQWNCYLAC